MARRAMGGSRRTGTTGLVLTGVSIACTIAVGVAGTSLMEPPLPGAPGASDVSGTLGHLPWSVGLQLSPYLAVGLAAAGLATGTLGLALTLRALRVGWRVNPRALLLAGVAAAIVAGTTRPFGSSDFLSYAAYGRELVTGHNPYAVAPAALARLGDPVARAVQDWAGTPSVYGALASGVFGFASLVGGTSARLTVFVLDLVNAAAFVATGLLLDRLAGGCPTGLAGGCPTGRCPARDRSTRDRSAARLRAAVLWTCNPLLLQILVAGGHVDSLAVAFGVAGIAVAAPAVAGIAVAAPAVAGIAVAAPAVAGTSRVAGVGGVVGGASRAVLFRGVAAGALIGLGFAVKPTVVLIGIGVAIASLTSTAASPSSVASSPSVTPSPVRNTANVNRLRGLIAVSVAIATETAIKLSRSRLSRAVGRSPQPEISRYFVICGLLAGFAVVAAADLVLIGRAGIDQTLRASGMVSVGSPWRVVRTVLSQFMAEPVADEVVRACAIVFTLCLAVALLRGHQLGMRAASPNMDKSGAVAGRVRNGGAVAGRAAFALVLAWLVAWPYVLPWYDALAWALLPLLPASGFDWALLARTAALGFGYLPARSTGITIPPGLRWMEPVIRSAVVPTVLAAVAAFFVLVALRRVCPVRFYRE
jgi:hypothetical protein